MTNKKVRIVSAVYLGSIAMHKVYNNLRYGEERGRDSFYGLFSNDEMRQSYVDDFVGHSSNSWIRQTSAHMMVKSIFAGSLNIEYSIEHMSDPSRDMGGEHLPEMLKILTQQESEQLSSTSGAVLFKEVAPSEDLVEEEGEATEEQDGEDVEQDDNDGARGHAVGMASVFRAAGNFVSKSYMALGDVLDRYISG
jgi:hypothetical protein